MSKMLYLLMISIKKAKDKKCVIQTSAIFYILKTVLFRYLLRNYD